LPEITPEEYGVLKRLLAPYLEGKREDTVDQILKLVRDGAGPEQFAKLAGRLQEVEDLKLEFKL
jgi:hypothetical protein